MSIYEEMAEESFAYDFIHEMSRSKLDDSDFGIPSQRKYPLNDAKHVKLAIKFFNYVDKEHEAELAKNIIKKIKEYNITDIKYSEKNRFFKYYKVAKEAAEDNSSIMSFNEAESASYRYVLTGEGDAKLKLKEKLYKLIGPAKYPSNPKKAILRSFDNLEKEPIKIAEHIWKNIKNEKQLLLKIDPKAVDEYGYRKIVSIEKSTTEKLFNKYDIKYEIQK